MSLEVIKMLEVNNLKIISQLTALESNLLNLLAKRGNRIVSKQQIGNEIYSSDMLPASNCIEVFIGRLRRKLNNPQALKTVRGRGYMLVLQKAPNVAAEITADIVVAREAT